MVTQPAAPWDACHCTQVCLLHFRAKGRTSSKLQCYTKLNVVAEGRTPEMHSSSFPLGLSKFHIQQYKVAASELLCKELTYIADHTVELLQLLKRLKLLQLCTGQTAGGRGPLLQWRAHFSVQTLLSP